MNSTTTTALDNSTQHTRTLHDAFTTHTVERDPREVRRAWTRWLKQHLHDDVYGRYVAFSLNTQYRKETLSQKFSTRCPDGVFVFLLPAVSRAGRIHYHGFIRVPVERIEALQDWTPAVICQQGCHYTIRVPRIIRNLLWNSHTKNEESAFGNLHLDNHDEHLSLITYGSGGSQKILNYWNKTRDGEVRMFSEGEFIPHEARKLVPVRKGRDPKPRVW